MQAQAEKSRAFPSPEIGREKQHLNSRAASCIMKATSFAGVMELVDVTDSKSVGSDTVWVRVPPPAPRRSKLCIACSDFFYKSQSALTPLLLLSKSNPLRWASIWFWVQTWKCGVYSVAMLHVAAKSALRPRLFMPMAKKMSSARSLAPSFQIESAARDLAAAQIAKPFEPQEIERMITSADWTFRLPVVQKRSPLFIRQVRLSLRFSVPAPSDSPRHLSSPAT